MALAHPAAPFLWEFALRLAGDVEQLVAGLRRRGILAGLALGRFDPDRDDQLLVCCTEMTPPAAIDAYVDAVRALVTHPEEVRA